MNIAATLVAIGVMPLKTNFKQIACTSSAVFSGRLKLTSLSGFKAGITETQTRMFVCLKTVESLKCMNILQCGFRKGQIRAVTESEIIPCNIFGVKGKV